MNARNTRISNKTSWNAHRVGLAAVAAGAMAFASLAGGCNNAGEGAMSGALLGGLAGMGIGSLTGDMGKGAAAGAILGGVGGAVLGDQNDRSGRQSNYGNEW